MVTRLVLKRKFALLKIRKKSNRFSVLLTAFILVILPTGCARKIPVTVPLYGDRQVNAEKILKILQQRKKVDCFDADVTITWSGYGGRRNFTGTLQATDQGRFRLNGLDPLGRPFFILTVGRQSFTFIDNRQGRGYTGSVNSTFVQNYIPAGVPFSVLYSMLTAQLPDTAVKEVDIRESDTGKSYWFMFPGFAGMKYLVETDEESGQPMRQIIMDQDEKVIFDIHYAKYQTGPDLFFLPAQLRIKSDEMPGIIELNFDKFYPKNILPDTLFTLRIPEYFDITHVQ